MIYIYNLIMIIKLGYADRIFGPNPITLTTPTQNL
jgi:hypothetical protein